MATIVLQAAGAYIGGLLGSAGVAIGTAAGALAGYLIDRALINGTQHLEGPRLAGARPFTAEEGVSLPRLYGTARLGGVLIWATRFEESKQTHRQGKLGPKVTEYSYYANAAFALCEGEIAGIRRVWADGREIDRENIELRIYSGSESQPADPLIEAKQGANNTPAYRGVAYVVVDRLDIGEFGNRIPQLQFEVIRPVGTLNRQIRAITLIPGSTEYGLSTGIVTKKNRPGDETAVNRHILFAGTDIAASLDELQMLCPNLEHVALVVSWFGNDLRASNCLIKPAVTSSASGGVSKAWKVSGVSRGAARVVTTHDGAAAYGGTPSDASVIEAIAAIKARGLGVTLYPFVMMDIAKENTLPDPYGGAKQVAYPWRGRVTASPAPMQPDTADCTAAARSQIGAFCGSALRTQFVNASETINFSGSSSDWGYRRFILHYAHLAVKAGGVDAFLIGSELRGLTTLRDAANAFPFVEQLCALAADVRLVLGAGTRITYGADWSEYFGHHTAGGDVFFHLDPLWAHSAIDAVGIDNYMPLSDWRDGDYAGENPDGFTGPYDPNGLAAAITSGEGFDWYYPTDAARSGRERSPITDGGFGKPWVYRYKDIASWWANPHHDRIGGFEQAEPTAWVPQAKPVWFTELGCGAVDKGPNQPNVFADPKSSENANPYFSDGGRSDIAQKRFIEAHMLHWNSDETGFEESWNPSSTIYGGRMVDPARIYVWTWDARPYPAFPTHVDVWSDGGNWDRGHWLNGRLANPDVGSLINAILADHGQAPADVSGVAGSVNGYVIADPTSARDALEPLTSLFDIAVGEEAAGLAFRQSGASNSLPVEVTELVVADDGAVVETVRTPDHQLPAEAILAFRDPFADYQAASVRSVRLGAPGSLQHTISFPGVLEKEQGMALLDDWLKRLWYQRETVTFSVAQPQIGVTPGALVTLPASGNPSDFIITGIEDGLVRRVSARQIVRNAPSPWRPSQYPVRTKPATANGAPHALFLDMPFGIWPGAAKDQFRVAAWRKPWTPQMLFASPEDSGFLLRGILLKSADLGRLTSPLAAGFEGRLDRMGSILVELFDADVASVSMAQLLNGANTAAVRSTMGAWEIVQFQSAEEISPQVWRLSGLLRGRLGTSDAMAAGSATGADFVILDDSVRGAGLSADEAGLLLKWRVGSLLFALTGSGFASSAEIGGIRSLLPFAPVHLKAKYMAGDLILSWVRRDRIDADGWEASEIPLSENREEYRLEIAPAGGAVLRSEIVAVPNWTYSAAAITADFGTPPAEIDVTIRQLSVAAGWGIPAKARLSLS